MKKLDKKQVPQFAALCILSAGVFGYFVVRMVTPSPAAAGTRPQPVAVANSPAKTGPAAPSPTAGSKADATAAVTAAAVTAGPDADEAVPPTPGMRDPFVVGYLDPKTAPAGLTASAPTIPNPAATAAPGLPPLGKKVAGLPPAPFTIPGVSPLPPGFSGFPAPGAKGSAMLAPALPSPPAWTVTGVVQSDWEKVAILRNGEARRIVRTGDFVDSVYRVVDVTRSSVTLRHGKAFYQLTLGAVKAAPVTGSPVEPARAPTPMPAPLVPGSAPVTGKSPAGLPLSQAAKSLAKLAQAWFASAPVVAGLDARSHIRATEYAPVMLQFLDDEAPTH